MAAEEKDGWLLLYSDGAARGNPGPAGIGGQALDEAGALLLEVSEFLGEATNNVAEYWALARLLELAGELGYSKVRIHTDSDLLANQVAGGYRVRSPSLKPLAARIKGMLEGYRAVEVVHIPREKNYKCDALANEAIEGGLAGRVKPLLGEEESSLF